MGALVVWFIASIVVPVFVPAVAMALASRALSNRRLHPYQILKDGQLLWFSTTLSAVGMAEAITTEVHRHSAWNVAFALGLFGVVACSLFILGCASLVDPKPLPEGGPWHLIRTVPMLSTSFLINLFAIVSCTIVHWRLPGV